MKNRTGLKPKQEETCRGTTQVAQMLRDNRSFKGMTQNDPRRSKVLGAIHELEKASRCANGTQLKVAHSVSITVGTVRNRVRSVYAQVCSALEIDA